MSRRILLVCGVFSSLLYVFATVFVALQWRDYSSASQTVSELSAIGAPTRSLWVALAIPYTLLMAAFGYGVWMSADRNPPLRITGGVMVVYGVLGLFWPPMHLREVLAAGGGTLTDTMHIVFAMVTVLLMMLAIGFGAAAVGTPFRLYSITTMVILAACGAMTGVDAPRLPANLPTLWIGVWERINIGVFLLWVVVLAATLWNPRETDAGSGRQSARAA
jgi:hypothetical protein